MPNNIEKITICNGSTNLNYVATVYKDNLTLLELILNTIETLNNTITVVNSNNDFINNLDDTIETLKNDVKSLQNDFENLENEIDVKLTTEFNKLNAKIISMFNDYKTIFDNSLYTLKEDLENQILNISLGQIQVYDPTTRSF